MAYAGILRALAVWDNVQLASVLLNRLNDIFEQEPEQGHIAPASPCAASKGASSCAESVSSMADLNHPTS